VSHTEDSVRLIYNTWERFLNAQSELFGGDREFTELSNKLDEVRSKAFADLKLTAPEVEILYEKLEAVAKLYSKLAARKGIAVGSSPPTSKESFRVFREDAEIHFQTLAGRDREHYRGGLLGELTKASDPDLVARRMALDILTSATTAIAFDKVNLLRAQLSLLGDGARQRGMIELVGRHLREVSADPVWSASGRALVLRLEEFESACRFESCVSVHHVRLPAEVQGTNRMLPNRPLPGWLAENRTGVHAVLADLRSAGKLFLERIEPSERPRNVALKIELNMGMEGAPSVTDPATTYAVIAELLEASSARGVYLLFTVGDSNGIENAPVGRTTMDIMKDTGNYHAALKAGLEWAADRGTSADARELALSGLGKIEFLAKASPPVFFGSAEDRVSSPRDLEAVEAAARPWVVCVDYDETGFRTVEPDLGPLGQAVWGTREFQIAEPWASADYRVHVSRGVSNHLFAGWTGALKGLVGLHALGLRPGDQGMNQRGESPLDVLSAVMQAGGFTGLPARRAGVSDFAGLAARCDNAECRSAVQQSAKQWQDLSSFASGRKIWAAGAAALEAELRKLRAEGTSETVLMAKMRQRTRAILEDAEREAPGFRASLWQGVSDGTRAFILTMWRLRDHLPDAMRDERMGLRIGLLSRLPHQADLVVQGLPKIGLGGGPDAYFEVRDAGIVVAGTDEISVDLIAIQEAGIGGNPWAFNHPVHGALQFGRGPMCWEEVRVLRRQSTAVSRAN